MNKKLLLGGLLSIAILGGCSDKEDIEKVDSNDLAKQAIEESLNKDKSQTENKDTDKKDDVQPVKTLEEIIGVSPEEYKTQDFVAEFKESTSKDANERLIVKLGGIESIGVENNKNIVKIPVDVSSLVQSDIFLMQKNFKMYSETGELIYENLKKSNLVLKVPSGAELKGEMFFDVPQNTKKVYLVYTPVFASSTMQNTVTVWILNL